MSHLMSLLGVKRTCPFALHMSAFDPKRTFAMPELDGSSIGLFQPTLYGSFVSPLSCISTGGGCEMYAYA